MRLDVPLIGQRGARACLPACARMVLAFYGVQISEEELSRLLGKTRAGTSLLNIELLEKAELGATLTSGEMDVESLKESLNRGVPVIAAVWTGPLPYWTGNRPHVVVVVGYDERTVGLNDPKFTEATRTVAWIDFLAAWEEFGRFSAVIRKAE